MSTRVVSETHVLGDDHVWVPTDDEFEELSKKVAALDRKCANVAEKCDGVDRRLTDAGKALDKQKEAYAKYVAKIDSLKKELAEQLSGGNWRVALDSAVGACVKDLEKRIGEIGALSAKQTSGMVAQLAKAQSLIDELNRIKENANKSVAQTVDQAVEVMSRKAGSLDAKLSDLAKEAESAAATFEATKKSVAEASASVSELLKAVHTGCAEFDESKKAAQESVAKVMGISAEANEIKEYCAAALKKNRIIFCISVCTGLLSVLSFGLVIWMYFH